MLLPSQLSARTPVPRSHAGTAEPGASRRSNKSPPKTPRRVSDTAVPFEPMIGLPTKLMLQIHEAPLPSKFDVEEEDEDEKDPEAQRELLGKVELRTIRTGNQATPWTAPQTVRALSC